jgi:hypothetical protein
MVKSTDVEYRKQLGEYITRSHYTDYEKMENFPKYVPRTSLARFLCKCDLYQKILDVQGCIIECGVLYGGGIMAWSQLSSIFEPMNHQRRIYGFDTFAGFPVIASQDRGPQTSELVEVGGLAVDSYDDIKQSCRIHDMYRPLGHIEKVELIKGDVNDTIPKFMAKKPHLIVSLLYLDFDIYKPTMVALRHFISCMPKGSIIAFDQLNSVSFPGETVALKDVLGVRALRLKRFIYGTSISYVVME